MKAKLANLIGASMSEPLSTWNWCEWPAKNREVEVCRALSAFKCDDHSI